MFYWEIYVHHAGWQTGFGHSGSSALWMNEARESICTSDSKLDPILPAEYVGPQSQ